MKKTLLIFRKQWMYHLMLFPAVVMLIMFSYVPMAGIIIAFQKFIPAKGLFGDQKWIGLDNFRFMFELPNFARVVKNTLFISVAKIVLTTLAAIATALMLNEITHKKTKKFVQSMIYMPNFLSWVIFAGIVKDILARDDGIVNQLITKFGGETVYFLGEPTAFVWTVILSDVLKTFGFSTVVYLAAISSVDQQLYEAALMDGAKRYQRVWHVTIPGMMPTIVLMATLNLGGVLNAGFDQIYNLYSPQVYETGDVISTFVYRIGFLDANYGLGTAVGLFKSLIGFVLISLSYYMAKRFANYNIF